MEIKDNFFNKNLSVLELEDFEKVNGVELPLEYKKFLLEFNGGRPYPNRNLRPDTYATYILGMHNGDYYASMYKHIDMFKNRLPFDTLPIATDPFGDLFIMSIHPDNYSQIFFWDHEGEPDVQDGNYTANCYFVAYSFNEFLKNLVN